jgi:ABC-type Fe3+ transport system substrate-binding protein
VNWKPLLAEGTKSVQVPEDTDMYGALIYWGNHVGLMYNPEKVSAAEVPKTLAELGDPKWKGKIGAHHYPSHWARWAFVIGKDKLLSNLRAIMENKPALGRFPDVNNRFLLGETPVAFLVSSFLMNDQDKGMPTAWQALDFVDIQDYSLVVPKGARHSNAAKLFAIYMASPEGVYKVTRDLARNGNRFYPENFEYDNMAKAKKEGKAVVSVTYDQKVREFSLSKEYVRWQKEIKPILQGGK